MAKYSDEFAFAVLLTLGVFAMIIYFMWMAFSVSSPDLTALDAAGDAGIAYLNALDSGDYAAAYAMMGAAYRAGHTEAEFATAASENPYLHGITEGALEKIRIVNEKNALIETILTTAAGPIDARISLVLEDEWKVAGLTIAGAPVFA